MSPRTRIRAQPIATAITSPPKAVTPKRPPKRPRPVTPRNPEGPEPLSDPESDSDTGPPTPTPNPKHSQGQLSLELQGHIKSAISTRTAILRSTGEEILDLISLIDQKITLWEKKELSEAIALGSAIRTLVTDFGKSIGSGDPRHLRAPTNTKDQPTEPAYDPSNPQPETKTYATAARTPPDPPTITPNIRPKRKQEKPEKPHRLFLRIPEDHPARQASPHAVTEILRANLAPAYTSAIKEIQHVPSGLAIWPRNNLGGQLLLEGKGLLEKTIQGSHAELEQKWAIYILPGVPTEYTGYDGSPVEISEHLALSEFKIQTNIQPLKFHRSKKDPQSNTLIMATPEDETDKVPSWVHLFGKNIRIKRKTFHPKITQCPKCWDFHNPRTCTRSPRCRTCGERGHSEMSHAPTGTEKNETPRCTNCCGPFPADHLSCPARPKITQGIFVRPNKAQTSAIRQAGSRAWQQTVSLCQEKHSSLRQSSFDFTLLNTASPQEGSSAVKPSTGQAKTC